MKIDYEAMTEAEQIVAVTQNGQAIKFIKNPSEAVCMAAVKNTCRTIEHIQNPSEAVCMAAVTQDGLVIQYIKNPSEAMLCEAVKKSPGTITFAPKPVAGAIAVTLLLHHPFYPGVPQSTLDRAPEILESHCVGLGDVYTIGLSMAMTGEDLSRTMIEWIESHVGITTGAEMAP